MKINKMFSLERVAEEFKNSGITKETVDKYISESCLEVIESIEEKTDLKISKAVNGGGWIMNYPTSKYYCFKPFNPRKDNDGKVLKYEAPYETETNIFCPIGFDIKSENVIITEGTKKAIKAQQEGFNTVSIAGVWNWRSKTGDNGINSNFQRFIERLKEAGKNEVYICFDNDVIIKEQVKLALERLSVYLLQNGIKPKVVKLPYNKGQKLGLDDYLTIEEADFAELLKRAKVMPEALLSLALKKKPIKVGKSVNVENLDIADFIREEYKEIAEGYYVMAKETYIFYKKIRQKSYPQGLLTKKADFAISLDFNAVTITQSITKIEEFGRQILIKSPHSSAKKVVTEISLINKADKFDTFLSNYGHFLHAFKDSEIRDYINWVLSGKKATNLYILKNYGFAEIEGQTIWATKNKIIPYAHTDINKLPLINVENSIAQGASIVENKRIEGNENFKRFANEAKSHYGLNKELSLEQDVTIGLLYNLEKSYNRHIQPFMILGLALLSPFVTWIFERFRSFPIGYLEGYTATGKSNLLNIVANLYGFDSRYPKSGNDTPKNILFHLQQNVSMPVLINEIGDQLRPKLNELIIKPVFDRTPRCRMKNNGKEEIATAVNSTLIFNTNAPINKESAITNRLLHTYWQNGIFNVDEAKKFNDFASYTSILVPHLIQNISITSVLDNIEKWTKSELLANIKDERHKVNIAISITGVEMFVNILKSENINLKTFDERMKVFVLEYENLAQDGEVERFFAVTRKVLTERAENIKKGVDYSEITHVGEKGLHIHSGKGSESFKSAFEKTYKSLYSDSRPLKMAEYQEILKKVDVKKVPATYGGESKYGLFIPYNKFTAVELWFKEYNEGVFEIESRSDGSFKKFKEGTEIF